MKNFKQLIRELPSNKVVAAFGQFQPPTAGHEHLVKAVQSIANNGDHVIYASANEDKKLNPLPADRKVYFLQRMFAEGNFKSSEGITSIVEMASELSKKYKHLTVVTFADKVGEYEQQLKEHNGTMYQFDSIKVISAGDIDPDSNTVSVVSNVKMCESAKTGDFTQFKKGVPHTLTELDSRRLMNDVRKGMGLDPIRENVIFERTKIREQYVAGKIFNVGDRVKDEDGIYEIMDRGANYITVVNESGDLMKKWIDKVSPSRKKIEENLDANPNEICFKNYTTANFNKNPKVFHAFKGTISRWEQGGIEDGVAVLNAIKHTDSYLSMTDDKDRTSEADKAKQALNRIGEYQSHNYWDDHKVITTDAVVAKHNADLQNAIKSVKEESEVMDSKKIAVRYKEFMKKAGSKEKAVDISEPSSGKPMSVLKNKEEKLKTQEQNSVDESVHDNRTGFRKREREDDEYHTPDPVKHTYHYTVSKEGGEKHKRSVTTGMTTNSKADMEHHARKHLEKQGYKIHESVIFESAYEKSEENKKSADAAKKQGDMFAHHLHMADHHDNLSQWHSEKGRHSVADIHAKKSEEHHEKAMGFKESVEQIDEISAKLAGNYYGAATKKHLDKVGMKPNMYGRIEKDMGKNRKAGVDRALDRVTGARKTNEEIEMIDELTTDLLARYKTKAAADAKAADQAGNYAKGDKRFKGINKATVKQFDNDLKKHGQFKEDIYSSDTKTKKVQVQDKDGNWVFKDRKSHPHRINFAASKMNGKPAQTDDPTKVDTATAYQKHLDKQAKDREKANEAWVLNPTGKSKKKYKDIKDNKTLSISNTAPFDAFSNTNNQT